MNKFLLLTLFIWGCSLEKQPSFLNELKAYEGKYEYTGNTTLTLQVSEMDTTLYAVINQAKYPLNYISTDSFINIQDVPVTFGRNDDGDVINYTTGGKTYALLNRDFNRMKMVARKGLWKNPEKYAYEQPEEIRDGLATGNLAIVFDNPEPIIDMVRETIKGTYPDVHSLLIYKDDKLVLEEYFYGYDRNTPHQLRSATKPFIGTLVGKAIDNGAIGSEQDKLLPYFNERYDHIANIDGRKKQITIEDFLMYRHGMDCENNNPESTGNEQRMMQSEDWVKYTLDLPMVREPGLSSAYCTGCALTLGSLVELTTNRKIEDFAKESLFDPMGMSNYEWRFDPDQTSMATFCQMSLTPRDMVKLAKMYMDGGVWQSRQILPTSWVEKTFNMEDGDYGYLWEHKYFMLDGKRYDSYLASGNGGQKINIWPELDMITVFTGGNYNSYLLYGKSTPPNEMIPKYILQTVNN